ncbi:MAG: nicotinate-nucleotide adenylyltransferase [Clostridia bacterium]|nr:nicotinate-nucleotide adenylyltransferase [Clostridia bacterium]
MERIALYGGMFDPVHLGHLHAARETLEALHLDRVIFIPASVPPHKKGCHADGVHRLRMLELATDGEVRFSVSDYELKKEGTSYSYETVQHFAALHPEDKLYFLIGDEAYALLHTWKNPEIIKSLAEFVVVTREGVPPEDALYVEIPKVVISSTEVRNTLKNNADASALLPAEVASYIKENGLYR